MIAGTFRPRWKKESRGPRPMCCQHLYIYISIDTLGESNLFNPDKVVGNIILLF